MQAHGSHLAVDESDEVPTSNGAVKTALPAAVIEIGGRRLPLCPDELHTVESSLYFAADHAEEMEDGERLRDGRARRSSAVTRRAALAIGAFLIGRKVVCDETLGRWRIANGATADALTVRSPRPSSDATVSSVKAVSSK